MRDAMTYCPEPIDTSHIVLCEELQALVEQLAENSHDLWARMRMSEGWKHGEQRNDDLRLHPCLVPYSELPESEKEYDRALAIATLKVIIARGYRIELMRP
jgi:hypothetical protein